MSKAYTLRRKKETKELHLFEGNFNQKPCTALRDSICNKMNVVDQDGDNIWQCKTEDEARIECAEIGKSVCGICVSHLYSSY